MCENDVKDTQPLLGNTNQANYSSYIGSSSWSGASDLHDDEEKIKKKLQWYFKSPYEKFKDRGRKPFKLFLQIVKIILVTTQAILFATEEFSLVEFEMDNVETFRNVFLSDYTSSDDPIELYTKKAVYEHMFYTWRQYYNFHRIMIGSYDIGNESVIPQISFCQVVNTKIKKMFNNSAAAGENNEKKNCTFLKPPRIAVNETDLEEFINNNHLPEHFYWISTMTLTFSFHVNYTAIHAANSPDCYDFIVKLFFDNDDLDGVMTVAINSDADFIQCRKTTGLQVTKHSTRMKVLTALDVAIIFICFVSLLLCVRSFKRHWKLCKDASRFFSEYRHEKFTLHDKMNFLSLWLVMITFSDMFSISGSIIKIRLDWMEYPELYTSCSLLFGMAVLFSWIGILRYLGFMKGYNTLLVTLKTAFPTIVRFLLCVLIIYIGFTVCGWIIFGPYHEKFKDMSVVSECLFSLVNGDDMFTTFSEMDNSDKMIWYISKIYLYLFISLFIFVVLGLFIGIVADTYERIKDYGHAPKTRIELFMEGKEYLADIHHRHGTAICNHQFGVGDDH